MGSFQKLNSFSRNSQGNKSSDFDAFKLTEEDTGVMEEEVTSNAGFADFSEDDFDFSPDNEASSAKGFSRAFDSNSNDFSGGNPSFELEPEEEEKVDIAAFELFSAKPRTTTKSTSTKKKNTVSSKKKNSKKNNDKMKIYIGAGAVAAIAAAVALCIVIFNQPSSPFHIDNGIEEITDANVNTLFSNTFNDYLEGKQVTVDTEGSTYDIVFTDYDFAFAPGGEVEEEYVNVPVDGDESKYSVEKISTSGCISYNETKIRSFINEVASEYGNPMVLPYYTIDGENLTVFKGENGMSIDFDDLVSKLVDAVKNQDYSEKTVALGVLQAPDVDMEQIYNEVACEPVDASYTVNEAGTVTYIDEVIGKDFDLAAATVTVENNADSTSWNIPLELTYPDVTVKSLKAPTCPDLLSTFSTKYSTGNKSRANNLELAAKYINGLVMQPGEVFSFNSTVGKRTAERGFKKAGVYTGEGLDEDYGGGICQTSTTLYGACLSANLSIVERRNHYYTVSYWKQAGTDATVSWGSCDYKFKNSKEYPIKITFECHNGTITCKIYGTDDGYTAKIENDIYDYKEYETIHKAKDSSKSDTHGANGMTVKTYRCIYKDGKFVEKKLEATSVYRPLNAIVYDGETSSATSTTKTTSKTTTTTTTKTTTKTTTTPDATSSDEAVG